LTAATQLHKDLLEEDADYDGTKRQFDRLYDELFIIARDEVSLEIEAVLQVIETFFEYRNEIGLGQREVDWYAYQ
jgi:hypothetical protein